MKVRLDQRGGKDPNRIVPATKRETNQTLAKLHILIGSRMYPFAQFWVVSNQGWVPASQEEDQEVWWDSVHFSETIGATWR